MTRGVLFLVATPIGNLEDITLRALRILGEADVIACEDTRHTSALLGRYGIRKRLVSYYGAREKGKAGELVRLLKNEKTVALVSDSGMPGISDPGRIIVNEALAAGARVIPVPGPSALVCAIAASGMEGEKFLFDGFLPRRRLERRARLIELSGESRNMVFYEAPHRLRETLEDMHLILGDRNAVVARELTKVHEEFLRGTVREILDRISIGGVRGEVVIVVGGAEESVDWERVDLRGYVEELQKKMGIERKEAVKLAAQLSGVSKSVVYKESLIGADGAPDKSAPGTDAIGGG